MSTPIHLHEALRALAALRDAAELPPQTFPIPAFVGMISDEVDSLRDKGFSDEKIATLIRTHSAIDITAEQIAEHYAPPSQRQRAGDI